MQSPLLSTKSPLVSTGYPRDSPDSKASSPYSTGHPHYFFRQSKSNAPQIDKSPFFQATTNRKTRTDIRINSSKTNNYEQKSTNKPRNLLTISPIQSNLHLFASTSPLHHPTTKKHSPPPSPPTLLSLSYRRICSRSTLHFVQKQLLLHTDTPVPWQHVLSTFTGVFTYHFRIVAVKATNVQLTFLPTTTFRNPHTTNKNLHTQHV